MIAARRVSGGLNAMALCAEVGREAAGSHRGQGLGLRLPYNSPLPATSPGRVS